ncbi:MAG: hypothetical protein RBT80_19225 [Candidatus Vecturithrix sp.]|jgi:hypothetical protein|nr:hypothetical protein [Candidatus Vecturithrix sp.]
MKKTEKKLPKIQNLALARMHKEVQEVNHLLKKNGNIERAICILDTLETRLCNLAYGDCSFPMHLVTPSVKREPLVIFPKNSDTKEVA